MARGAGISRGFFYKRPRRTFDRWSNTLFTQANRNTIITEFFYTFYTANKDCLHTPTAFLGPMRE